MKASRSTGKQKSRNPRRQRCCSSIKSQTPAASAAGSSHLGCGTPTPEKAALKGKYSEGVDIFKPSIEECKSKEIHNKYHLMNVLDISKRFKQKSFDCVMALDLIEHLKKSDGLKLMRDMENIARKKVINYTPNGFFKQQDFDKNPWQEHKSGRDVEEMRKLGYYIIGINGIKGLRGAMAEIKYRPRFFWRIFSDITQLFTRRIVPQYAFQILCIKKLG